jgi:hypothetical protein
MAFHARGKRLHDARMREAGVGDALQLGRKQCGLFGKKIDAERLYGNQPIALWFVSAENRAENAAAYLMQDAKRAERSRR